MNRTPPSKEDFQDVLRYFLTFILILFTLGTLVADLLAHFKQVEQKPVLDFHVACSLTVAFGFILVLSGTATILLLIGEKKEE